MTEGFRMPFFALFVVTVSLARNISAETRSSRTSTQKKSPLVPASCVVSMATPAPMVAITKPASGPDELTAVASQLRRGGALSTHQLMAAVVVMLQARP